MEASTLMGDFASNAAGTATRAALVKGGVWCAGACTAAGIGVQMIVSGAAGLVVGAGLGYRIYQGQMEVGGIEGLKRSWEMIKEDVSWAAGKALPFLAKNGIDAADSGNIAENLTEKAQDAAKDKIEEKASEAAKNKVVNTEGQTIRQRMMNMVRPKGPPATAPGGPAVKVEREGLTVEQVKESAIELAGNAAKVGVTKTAKWGAGALEVAGKSVPEAYAIVAGVGLAADAIYRVAKGQIDAPGKEGLKEAAKGMGKDAVWAVGAVLPFMAEILPKVAKADDIGEALHKNVSDKALSSAEDAADARARDTAKRKAEELAEKKKREELSKDVPLKKVEEKEASAKGTVVGEVSVKASEPEITVKIEVPKEETESFMDSVKKSVKTLVGNVSREAYAKASGMAVGMAATMGGGVEAFALIGGGVAATACAARLIQGQMRSFGLEGLKESKELMKNDVKWIAGAALPFLADQAPSALGADDAMDHMSSKASSKLEDAIAEAAENKAEKISNKKATSADVKHESAATDEPKEVRKESAGISMIGVRSGLSSITSRLSGKRILDQSVPEPSQRNGLRPC